MALVAGASAQQHTKRLILKDGSYQLATQWQVEGDRVRYYSAERSTWEELPNDMVDWAATDKYEKSGAPANVTTEPTSSGPGGGSSAASGDGVSDADLNPLMAAPGLRLPEQGGIYLLDNFRGQKQLVEIVQNGSELNKQMGKNILRAVIIPIPTSVRQSFELKGAHASVYSHTEVPVLFVNIDYASGDGKMPELRDRFRILRLKSDPKKNKRVVANVKVAIIGKTKEERDALPTVADKLNSEWVKITPVGTLEPGEYALAEMLDARQMNMYVWDFSVDPGAPANRTAWKPEAPRKTDTGTTESPVLLGRPK